METIYLAYYSDHSDVVPFHNEIDALRYAIEHGMQVAKLLDGESLSDYMNRA